MPDAAGFVRDKRNILLLLAACSLVLLPYASHLPGWIILFCTVLLGWRAWINWQGKRLPAGWLLVLLTVAGMAGVYVTYGTLAGREAGVALLVVLLACKLLEMRARRDLFVVAFLSFFLMLTHFFHSQSLLTAASMLAALLLILCVQVSLQFVQTLPPLGMRLRLAARILALATPLALVLFVLFPRVDSPLWGRDQVSRSAGSGLSDSMSPGDISELALSAEVAFRVRFFDTPPSTAALYWRGPVLGDFDGRSWRPLRPPPGQRLPLALQARQAPIHYQVMLEPTGQRHLFALEVPHSVPHLRGNPVWLTADLQLLASHPLQQRVQYAASSTLDAAVQAQADAAALAPWRALPAEYNPAARVLAARLRRQHDSDSALAQAVLVFFRQENFHYTLQPPTLGRHTVDEFLFATQAGFCEHYASAFVFLMRAAGIPARVVTGYQGGELNPVDGRMTVRQSDAHAWAEIWLPGKGWQRVDPTAAVAPERISSQQRAPSSGIEGLAGWGDLAALPSAWQAPLHFLQQGWEAFNAGWNRWVLDYSAARQKSLVESFGFETVDWRVLSLLLLGGSLAVATLVLTPLLRQRRRPPPAEALYQRLCRQLARLGYPRASHEGPRAYASRLAAEGVRLTPRQRAAALRFLQLYETLRYGRPQARAHGAAMAQLHSLLKQCR